MRIWQSLLIQAFFWNIVSSVELDIHLPVVEVDSSYDLCPYNFAIASNQALKKIDSSGDEKVNFIADNVPHISLFLTDFDLEEDDDIKKKEIVHIVTKSIGDLPIKSCRIYFDGTFSVHSGYAIWNIQVTPCLQKLSDSLVEATEPYVKNHQRVPSWVWNLPEPQRSEKIKLVEKYGSPNVFASFQPHMTVGYNTKTTETQKRQVMETLLKKFHFNPDQHKMNCQGAIIKVGVGRVGESGGTVLKKGLIKLNIYQHVTDSTDSEIQQEE